MKPVVSIITVVFNDASGLKRTLESSLAQTFSDKEIIVVDGGSTDGTIDVLKSYQKNQINWKSEPDNGIYHAMNKGIDRADGTWSIFMNAGDTFYDQEALANALKSCSENDALIYGETFTQGSISPPHSLRFLNQGIIMACHQSMLFNKDLLKSELHYDLAYQIYGDYELVNRIYLKFPQLCRKVDVCISTYEGGGISSEISWKKRKEKYAILFQAYGIKGLMAGFFKRVLG